MLSNTQPILIVDDNSDDPYSIEDVWKKLNYKNELIFFKSGEEASVVFRLRKDAALSYYF
jgi:CheY-like chemotaxis protein